MLGAQDLKQTIKIDFTRVECPVKGCQKRVERQRHSFKSEEKFQCPNHKIFISPSTFEYPDKKDNLLWTNDTDLGLLDNIKDYKRESRMARDNSEDALTWNVFRYLETGNHLDALLSKVTQAQQSQTELIYWSYSQKTKGVYPKLEEARKEFGEHQQRSSEPDLIAVTNQALFFIEAKLMATNETSLSDPNNHKKYLTGGSEWHKQVFKSDFDTIVNKDKKYELFRFWLLGSWMAKEMGLDFYLVNVVLSEREKDIEPEFGKHIQDAENQQFKRLTWEEIYNYIVENAPDSKNKHQCITYFQEKTIGYDRDGKLKRAFSIVNEK